MNNEELVQYYDEIMAETVEVFFGKDYKDQNIKDLLKELERSQWLYNARNNTKINLFREKIGEIKKDTALLASGVKGENRCEQLVKQDEDLYKYLKNVVICEELGRAEADILIIGKGGIFNVEVKNCNCDLEIDASGIFSNNRDIIEQLVRTAGVFRKVLKNKLEMDIYVENVIFNANYNHKIEDKTGQITVLNAADINPFFQKKMKEEILTDEEIEKVVYALEGIRMKNVNVVSKYDKDEFIIDAIDVKNEINSLKEEKELLEEQERIKKEAEREERRRLREERKKEKERQEAEEKEKREKEKMKRNKKIKKGVGIAVASTGVISIIKIGANILTGGKSEPTIESKSGAETTLENIFEIIHMLATGFSDV